jgi:hypothetical protein
MSDDDPIAPDAPLATGTLCYLDGTVVRVFRWGSTYRTQPADDDHATWRGDVSRDQLTPLTAEQRRDYLSARKP